MLNTFAIEHPVATILLFVFGVVLIYVFSLFLISLVGSGSDSNDHDLSLASAKTQAKEYLTKFAHDYPVLSLGDVMARFRNIRLFRENDAFGLGFERVEEYRFPSSGQPCTAKELLKLLSDLTIMHHGRAAVALVQQCDEALQTCRHDKESNMLTWRANIQLILSEIDECNDFLGALAWYAEEDFYVLREQLSKS